MSVQRGDIMKGTSDESSTVIGLRSLDEVGINYELRASDGSSQPACRRNGSIASRLWEEIAKRQPLNDAETPADIL